MVYVIQIAIYQYTYKSVTQVVYLFEFPTKESPRISLAVRPSSLCKKESFKIDLFLENE